MSALTNYDRFAGIGDDEEAEEAAARPPRPVVTRLDNASTITIGGGSNVVMSGMFHNFPTGVLEALDGSAGRLVLGCWPDRREHNGAAAPRRH